MGAFESTNTFFKTMPDLAPVAEDVMGHFRDRQFDVKGERRITGDWDISITRGTVFKTVCGLRTALKIELRPEGNQVFAKASVGIFGQQVIPSVISFFLLWPVLLTQIWGLVKQSKLDDEAIRVIGESLDRHAPAGAPATATTGGTGKFCTACGGALPHASAFCPHCGGRVEDGISSHTQ